MTILICSRKEALELASATQVKTAIISITSKEDADILFSANPNIAAVLHLKFNDLTEAYDEEGIPYGRPLPKQADFDGLQTFVDGLSCECLIVHCWEGTSRSAAVAEAVYEYRGRIDELSTGDLRTGDHKAGDHKTGRRLSPNPLVYALARRELGKKE